MDQYSETVADSDDAAVYAGFPNPALGRRGQEGHRAFDLNQLFVRHPGSTYVLRVRGHSWADQGVYDGDVVVVDRSLQPRTTDLVLSWPAGELKLFRYAHYRSDGRPWGVVTAVIHPVGQPRHAAGEQTA